MEKRRSVRISAAFRAGFISGDASYDVNIENLSEHGINIRTAPTRNAIDFTPGTPYELKFQLPSGETLCLHCGVKWFHMKTSPDGLTYSIGIEIIDPPLKYREFLKTL